MKFEPGNLIAGRYKVHAFHREGGMQEVYRCFDLVLDRMVALKTPKRGIVDKRFSRGAQMGARITHPNVAATLDYVEDSSTRCLVEEFIHGEDLGNLLANDFIYFDPSLTAWVAHNIAKGLQAAHKVGICHRDLKPSNIMTSGGSHMNIIKLTDFGIAKLAAKEIESEMEQFENDENTLTTSNTLLGAVPYLAPECWTDWSSAGQPADIWALGAIICHLLLGRAPFGGGKAAIATIVRAQMTGQVKIDVPQWFGKHPETARLEQELWTMALSCLMVDPLLRPDADSIMRKCEEFCYSVSPRKTGIISTYPHIYPNGSRAKAGFIRVDGGDQVFFHISDYFGINNLPQVGQRVNFAFAPGKPKQRCSPVLLLKSVD